MPCIKHVLQEYPKGDHTSLQVSPGDAGTKEEKEEEYGKMT
jgi:hypothetical protein